MAREGLRGSFVKEDRFLLLVSVSDGRVTLQEPSLGLLTSFRTGEVTDNSRVIPEGSPSLSGELGCIDYAGSAERREEGVLLSVSPGHWELRTGRGRGRAIRSPGALITPLSLKYSQASKAG